MGLMVFIGLIRPINPIYDPPGKKKKVAPGNERASNYIIPSILLEKSPGAPHVRNGTYESHETHKSHSRQAETMRGLEFAITQYVPAEGNKPFAHYWGFKRSEVERRIPIRAH